MLIFIKKELILFLEACLKLCILSVGHASLRRDIDDNCWMTKEFAHFYDSTINVFRLQIAELDVLQTRFILQAENSCTFYLEFFPPMSKIQAVKYLFTKKAAKSVAATALEKN